MACIHSICVTLTSLLAGATALAGEVSADRLTNADKEPHNWLMREQRNQTMLFVFGL